MKPHVVSLVAKDSKGVIKANTIENELREKIVKLALLQLNKLYVHGSHGPDSFDCASLAWYLYEQLFGINIYENGFGLSTTTMIMTGSYGKLILFEDNCEDNDLSLINKGDVLFFHRQSKEENEPKPDNKYPGHCGVYIGDNRFIHCTRKNKKVLINDFSKSAYWNKVLVGSKDIISDNKILTKSIW